MLQRSLSINHYYSRKSFDDALEVKVVFSDISRKFEREGFLIKYGMKDYFSNYP